MILKRNKGRFVDAGTENTADTYICYFGNRKIQEQPLSRIIETKYKHTLI